MWFQIPNRAPPSSLEVGCHSFSCVSPLPHWRAGTPSVAHPYRTYHCKSPSGGSEGASEQAECLSQRMPRRPQRLEILATGDHRVATEGTYGPAGGRRGPFRKSPEKSVRRMVESQSSKCDKLPSRQRIPKNRVEFSVERLELDGVLDGPAVEAVQPAVIRSLGLNRVLDLQRRSRAAPLHRVGSTVYRGTVRNPLRRGSLSPRPAQETNAPKKLTKSIHLHPIQPTDRPKDPPPTQHPQSLSILFYILYYKLKTMPIQPLTPLPTKTLLQLSSSSSAPASLHNTNGTTLSASPTDVKDVSLDKLSLHTKAATTSSFSTPAHNKKSNTTPFSSAWSTASSSDDDDEEDETVLTTPPSPKPAATVVLKTDHKRAEEAGFAVPEPLLTENPHRFVLFPIQDNEVC